MIKKITIITTFSIILIIIFSFSISRHHSIENGNITIENTVTTVSQAKPEFEEEQTKDESNQENILTSTEDINLYDIDGKGKNFSFTYKNENFSAIYSSDNWHIVNSYKIKNTTDIYIICQALINIHPIHGNDMVSFRTAKDMTYEWLQHNLAYEVLPEDSSWKEHAKNVDLDSTDQGKNLLEMYRSRKSKY